jgi:molecular chaperone GrpE
MAKKEQTPVEENQSEESSAKTTREDQITSPAEAQATQHDNGSSGDQFTDGSTEIETAVEQGEVVEQEEAVAQDGVDADETAEEAAPDSKDEVIAELEAELAEAKAKADQYLDQMQRTAAEFQNARRRQERQLQEQIDRATEGLIRRLLPVLDDFELALNNVPSSLQAEETAWVDGFQRIHQKLSTLLIDEGVTPVEKEGPFDPNRHEAITNEPSDEFESGHIIETLRTGYEYRDQVLRPALVRVAQ